MYYYIYYGFYVLTPTIFLKKWHSYVLLYNYGFYVLAATIFLKKWHSYVCKCKWMDVKTLIYYTSVFTIHKVIKNKGSSSKHPHKCTKLSTDTFEAYYLSQYKGFIYIVIHRSATF